MGKITKYLNQLITGNVFDAPSLLEEYSTDRSALKVRPKFIAFPESTEDVRKLMRFINQIAAKDIPASVTVWGSGLDEGGADLSNSLIISTEKLNKLLEIDPRERLVHVQAGITLKELNTALSVSGLTIPIGGHDNETIGGLISNNPKDLYHAKYGGIGEFVERIEAILSNGECLQTERLKKYAVAKKAADKTHEGEIYRKVSKLLKEKEDFIERQGLNHKTMVGYPGIAKVKHRESVDLTPLFLGAQGTLGVITEVILRAIPMRKAPMRVVATFKELEPALDYMAMVSEINPREINVYDLRVLQDARETGKNLDGVIRRLEEGFVVFASFDERQSYCLRRIESFKHKLPRTAKFIVESAETKKTLNEFENSLASYLAQSKNGERIPILTDFYLPSGNIKSFLDDLKILGDKLKLDLALYGSYSTSIYNLRPKFKLDDPELNKRLATFLRAGAYVIHRQGGALAGGTPEGRLKAVVTNPDLLEPEKEIYDTIKGIFDSNNILNPDAKLGASSKFTLTHFRNTPLPKIPLQ